MSKYFLHIDGRQVGPYSKEELQQIRITRDTMLWFEGQEQWEEAGSVSELADLFKHQPPPFQPKQATPPPMSDPIQSAAPPSVNKSFLTPSTIALICLGFIVVSVSVYLYRNNQEQKEAALQEQLEIKQEELQKQRELTLARELAHQEEEAKRIAEEERQKELQKLRYRYDHAVEQLEEAYAKLEKIKEFHFLRTFSEKEAQIENQTLIIKSWEKEVERLKTAINQR
jgi:hypothetical protein